MERLDPAVLLQGCLPAVLEEGAQLSLGALQRLGGRFAYPGAAEAEDLERGDAFVVVLREVRLDCEEAFDVLVGSGQRRLGGCLHPGAALQPEAHDTAAVRLRRRTRAGPGVRREGRSRAEQAGREGHRQ